jgi:hypothetical protein
MTVEQAVQHPSPRRLADCGGDFRDREISVVLRNHTSLPNESCMFNYGHTFRHESSRLHDAMGKPLPALSGHDRHRSPR